MPTEPTTHDIPTDTREFTYYPSDFGKLPVKVEHFNIIFDMFDDHTLVESAMTLTVLEPRLKKISLDAKNMEVLEVALYEKIKAKGDHEKQIQKKSIQFHYDIENFKLHIELPHPKMKGDIFSIFTKTITRPTRNILEGLYYDDTPEECPPTQITQCQQWGLQRIVPCFDDMTAKCTYTTTIIADSRYTNMISNGDLAPGYKDEDGFAKKKLLDNNRAIIQYYNHKTPMAPYLFFLCVGTYTTFRREFEYPTGKRMLLELLVPKSAEKTAAEHALDILSYGIMWVYKHTGYVYTGDIYREIGMQNSNFGGMENVGNTTIVTNRIIPFTQITDESFEYMMEVKTHEFYHNLNGSEVTGMNPFVLWLNEAVTCHIETEYLSNIMGEAYTRISRVMTLHAPMFGTFAEDSGPAAMPIIPEGFNTPDELITGMTYVKAPEFVKMIETLMGKMAFVKALHLYHQRFKHKNATTEDWIAAMEEISGFALEEMAKSWLTRTGFPRVYVHTTYEDGTGNYTITLHQKGFDKHNPWQFPFLYCLVDKKGEDMLPTQIFLVKKEKEQIVHHVEEEPAYISLNRNHALYGKVFLEQQTRQQIEFQAKTDSDPIARYMAFSTIVDQEKVKLVHSIDSEISSSFISLYGTILFNTNLTPEVKALFLAITESVRDETVNYKYKEIYSAKEKIRKTIATTYYKELIQLYKKFSAEKFSGTYIEQQLAGMKNRAMKNLVLGLLASRDIPDVLALVKKQLQGSDNATDKNTAMTLYLNSSASDKQTVLLNFKKEAEQHLVSWENFLRIVGSNNSDDAIQLMKEIEYDLHFRIEQSNDQRALYLSFASNRKKSLLTVDGLKYLTEIMIRISKVNEYTGFHLLAAFSDLEKLGASDQIQLVEALHTVREALSKKQHPSVYNNIQRILKNCPNALQEWKKVKK